MSHIAVDGMRFSEFYRDISCAYCGQDVPMRDLNRQHMMFEGFSKHFSPEDKEECEIPKTKLTGREPFTPRLYPNESRSVEILHASKELIDDMKARVAPFIPKRSFVSTADIMNALLWMLSCEVNADCDEVTNSTDLGITGTAITYVAELCCNGLGVIPSNYLGNAMLLPLLFVGDDLKSKSLIEVLASLAALSRQKQIEIKEHPKQVFKYLVETCKPFPSVPDFIRVMTTNFCKFAISDTDFGRGSPSLFLCHSAFPGVGLLSIVSPVLHNRGVFLILTVTNKQKERLKKSSILKECAPRLRFLFDDFGTTELNDLIKQK